MQFIAFDLETTGILPGVDRIVEIGAVKFNGEHIDSVFSTLVDPGIPIPEGASRVNQIFDDMVAGKPTIESLLDSFAEFCGDLPIIAHNASFDAQFLTADIKKFETKAPRGVILDTFAMAKRVLPGLPNYKLGTLVTHMGIEASTFHRAEDDASYCGQLFYKMIQKISQHGEVPPLENLIALSAKGEMRFPQITPQPKQLNLL